MQELQARQREIEVRVIDVSFSVNIQYFDQEAPASASHQVVSQGSVSTSIARKRKERWSHLLDLPAWGLPLPPARARAISRLPNFEVALPDGEDVLAVFCKESLSSILGTSRHSIFAR